MGAGQYRFFLASWHTSGTQTPRSASTLHGVDASFEERLKGSLGPGKLADMGVLAPTEIREGAATRLALASLDERP